MYYYYYYYVVVWLFLSFNQLAIQFSWQFGRPDELDLAAIARRFATLAHRVYEMFVLRVECQPELKWSMVIIKLRDFFLQWSINNQASGKSLVSKQQIKITAKQLMLIRITKQIQSQMQNYNKTSIQNHNQFQDDRNLCSPFQANGTFAS